MITRNRGLRLFKKTQTYDYSLFRITQPLIFAYDHKKNIPEELTC
ncbi:hypothetical protein CPK_ORF00891 [Chlamydia pneumoniae LPCoLN]|nr:hypothetical protein CPK_ORF00891 [Chlamydia pneumoniae LPCoLN]ETR80280.1 hypothetical protein X556_0407 [Chlamydia pneumoniae B21]